MFAARLQSALGNPGKLYNIGNAIILVGSIGGALAAALGDGNSIGLASRRVVAHLWGSPSALALTLATLVFFASGIAYSAAWKGSGPLPNKRLSTWGDVLSGIGALVLGVGLMLVGNALLAICAGLLSAFGKFGSAFGGGRVVSTPAGTLPFDDLCKDLVLVSRIPALLAALSGLVQALARGAELAVILLATSVVISTIYWALADMLLLRRNGMLMTSLRRLSRRNGNSSAA